MHEVKDHLEAFIHSFVVRNKRDRWKHLFIEKPRKALQELHKLNKHLDSRYCVSTASAHKELDSLEKLGLVKGVYFDGTSQGEVLSAQQAVERVGPYLCDAVFSVQAGKNALVFHHDSQCWLCRRTN